ncbi:heparinase II/III family protein [Candidatus Babeliales bacterium]|nr:heparinase II/III family protein [Candidatus Babeliales bacterium]
MISRLTHYLKRLSELGPRGLHATLQRRLIAYHFTKKLRQKALAGTVHSTWHNIQYRYRLPELDDFIAQLHQNNIVHNLLTNPTFAGLLPTSHTNPAKIIHQADLAVQKTFSILGSAPQTFTTIPWQHDFKLDTLNQQEFSSSSNVYKNSAPLFYTDITIPNQPTTSQHYQADIKIPWDLSRFHHAFFLGSAYQLTHDQQYSNAFFEQAHSWITANPFLLGVNWVCAMDVAIRAINLIWGFLLCQPTSAQAEQLICSLYDHAIYLAANNTASDKANNHYVAELLGSLYLTTFFKAIPYFEQKIEFYKNKLEQEFERQIQPDGTSYEGSTAYHRLDTEMYLHFASITNVLSKANKTDALINFLAKNTTANGTLIKIGDDDSGKLVTGLHIPPTNQNHATTYPNFGLSIIKHNQWHITFRHPTFAQTQPSGHFHHDQLAFTLSLSDTQLLTDPGSYLYTANASWRNEFRSAPAHTTFFAYCAACKHNQSDLFQLARKSAPQAPKIQTINNRIMVRDSYQACPHLNATLNRTLTLDTTNNKLIIEDWFESTAPVTGCWNFIGHPEITLTKKEQKTWIFQKNEKPMALLTSTLDLQKNDTFFAPEYGVRLASHKLTAEQMTTSKQTTVISWSV